MPPRRTLRSHTNNLTSHLSAPTPANPPRPRRTASKPSAQQVTIARDPSTSPEGSKKAIHLTVKMPSSKLREATSGKKGGQTIGERERLEPAEIVSGPRGSRAKKSYVVESESEDEEEQEEEEDDEDAEGDEDEDMEEEDEEEEALPIEEQIGEPERSDDDVSPDEGNDVDEEEEELEEAGEESADADADGDDDVDMEDESPMPAPIPVPKKASATIPSKPSVTVTPAQAGPLKSVEAKEMSMADEDEEDEDLSSIESDGEDVEQDDADDGDAQSLGMGSRGSTPDVSKMTKRQRSRLDQVMGSDDFLQLPMEPQQKKILTAEEHAMRRAEMARRRKNLSEKRNEEEKMDTINRLLKKQAPKRRGKISAAEIAAATSDGDQTEPERVVVSGEMMEVERANPVYVRWVSDREGMRVGVPGEWMEGRAGAVFERTRGVERRGRRVVEVVEG
ncbi:MAG: hypothetical protein Q9195_005054 [Heterodermia aff. obscurata]